MKTTELFVEQMLIGLVVLFTGVLLWSPFALGFLCTSNAGEITVLLAFSYLLGIVYDRVADTLLDGLEHHHRLQFALARIDDDPKADDPFPEDRYRIEVLGKEGPAEYAAYLRSRIRLTRALATIAPATCAGVTAWVLDRQTLRGNALAAVVLLAYSIAFVARIRGSKKGRLRTAHLREAPKRESYVAEFGDSKDWFLALVPRDPIGWVGIAVAASSGVAAGLAGRPAAGAAAFAITCGSQALFLWTWWRITETFYTFLHDQHRFAPEDRHA